MPGYIGDNWTIIFYMQTLLRFISLFLKHILKFAYKPSERKGVGGKAHVDRYAWNNICIVEGSQNVFLKIVKFVCQSLIVF